MSLGGWIFVALTIASSQAQAIDWKRMVMPGELVQDMRRRRRNAALVIPPSTTMHSARSV